MSMILTLNAGSSSVKFGLYCATDKPEPEVKAKGQIDGLGLDAQLIVQIGQGPPQKIALGSTDQATGISAILQALAPILAGRPVSGVGHRIVHGGPNIRTPMILNAEVLADLRQYIPLAPLHQPHNLAAVAAAQAAFPDALQVGCFDTAFHRDHPWVNDTFALPRRYYAQGVRRYGFHGLSYDYITSTLAQDYPDLAAGRVIVAHLGNGASIAAIRDGHSIGSSMGFSALDGLPMGTRSGQIDPGVLLYLMDHEGLSGPEISHILYKESGLKGLSGISHDMRVLLASDAPEAAEAIEYYVFRLRREIGAMAAVLGGIDGLVFTGGIGENAAPIRAKTLSGMEFLGLELDQTANHGNGPDIGVGPVRVLVIPTNEEQVIARATLVAVGLATTV